MQMQPLTVLQNSILFRDFSSSLLTGKILPQGQLQHYAHENVLITPQQQVNWLGIVISGRVLIQNLFLNGDRNLMSVVESQEILGAELVCTQSRISPYYATASTPTVLFLLPAELFFQPGLLPEPERLELLSRLLHLVANENMKKSYRLAILSRKGLRDRILTYLSMQAAKRHTNTFTIPFSRDDMASFLCVNRSALSHELSQMQQEGLIAFHKNQFTLKSNFSI